MLRMIFRTFIVALAAMALLAPEAAVAKKNTSFTVVYGGQGLIADGFGGYDLNTEICGVANGADVDGPYLLWVLTATGATSATITGPWGTADMTASGNGTFKYVSGWYAPSTLPGNVSATYAGTITNAQLVISHGCRPFTTNGAWCSPGFWQNATDAAWALTGYARSDLFNSTVIPNFYATAFGADPTLNTTLTDNAYRSGQLADNPFGLTPFNATGAFLSDNIPGFDFDINLLGQDESNTCPIDHFGNWK
jgi:hypothetical protein